MRRLLDMAKRFEVHRPLSPIREITAFVSEWERTRGDFPTFMFRKVIGYEGTTVTMNLWDGPTLDARLGVPATSRGEHFLGRLGMSRRDGRIARVTPALDRADSLRDLPILHHQPRETAPYLTSFLGCIHDPETDTTNTGFYRGQVLDGRRVAVFMDARTDAHAIWRGRLGRETEIPFVMYAGGDIRCYLIAASSLPRELDSFEVASRLDDDPLSLAQYEDVHFAGDAEVVLRGVLTSETTREGPFGEFKGYYSGTTDSPVFRVEAVLTAPGYVYPGLLCGKRDGLTLMSYSNELLMARHLAGMGYSVDRVVYDLAAFGEYQVEIVTRDVMQEGLLRAAMDHDRRAKILYVTDGHNTLGKTLSYSPLDFVCEPYIRHGRPEGERIGIVAHDVQHKYDWSEY